MKINRGVTALPLDWVETGDLVKISRETEMQKVRV